MAGSKPRKDWREGPLDLAELRSRNSEGGRVVHERVKGGLEPMGVSTHERRLRVLRLGSCGVPHHRHPGSTAKQRLVRTDKIYFKGGYHLQAKKFVDLTH